LQNIFIQLLIFLFFTEITLPVLGQEKKEGTSDEQKRCVIFSGSTSLCLPQKDLANEFGTMGEIGASIMYQSQTRWLMGLDFGYFFGNSVKNDPIANLRNEDGNVIGNNGSYATFKIFMRGFQFPLLKFGKTIALSKNPVHNTFGGLTLLAGAGWLQHWTQIQDLSKKTPQFSEDYIDGYDRLTSGTGFGAWVGYIYLPAKSKLNFHLEGGYFLASTQTRRYNFSTNTPPGEKRVDGIMQLRLRICFTVKSKTENEFYYY
jgi:hypothetical protein